MLRADSTDLLLSYVAQDGSTQTATRAQDVPEDARAQVVVIDLSASPEDRQSDKYVFLADLRSPRADGSYPVTVASRYATRLEGAAGSADSDGVVLYTTSWCGVCKKAKRQLKAWKVPFVEKDIEASRSAQAELSAKAAKNNMQARGVPVIDVDGILLSGFDPGVLQSALQSKGLMAASQ